MRRRARVSVVGAVASLCALLVVAAVPASSASGATNDQTHPITLNGAPVNVALDAGEIGEYTFTGTTGQQVSARVTGSTFPGCTAYVMYLMRPDGSRLDPGVKGCGASKFFDSRTLDQDGAWAIVIDPQGAAAGTAQLNGYTFTDLTGRADLSGKTVKLPLIHPGQNARYAFSGTTGERISVYSPQSDVHGCPAFLISLAGPRGANVGPVNGCGSSAFLDAHALPRSGTWKVVIDPHGANTGTVYVRVFKVGDSSAALTPNGSPKTFTSSVPGRNASFSFSGATGDQRTVTISYSTFTGCPAIAVSLRRPDGTRRSRKSTCGADLVLGPSALDAAGTWRIAVDPAGPSTGTLIIQLS